MREGLRAAPDLTPDHFGMTESMDPKEISARGKYISQHGLDEKNVQVVFIDDVPETQGRQRIKAAPGGPVLIRAINTDSNLVYVQQVRSARWVDPRRLERSR